VAIFRDGMLAKILVSKGEDVVSVSGYPKENDTLILGTKKFFESIPGGVLKAALESGGPVTAAEALAPSIHASSDTGNFGAVILGFDNKNSFVKSESENSSIDVRKNQTSGVPNSVRTGINHSLSKIGEGLKKTTLLVFGKIFPRGVYIRERFYNDKPQSKKTTLLIGTIILVILFVSIAFGVRKQRDMVSKSRYEGRLNEAQKNYDEAVSLAGLDPNRARELFLVSKEEAVNLRGEGIKDVKLDALIDKIDESLVQVL
jgi:hypothetical protein